MADEATSASDKTAKETTAAIDLIRATTKWLIGVFAAVGAVLVAGTQLSSIGALALGDIRLWVAVVAFALALVATLGVVTSSLTVLLPGHTHVFMLRDVKQGTYKPERSRKEVAVLRQVVGFIESNPSVFYGYGPTVADLADSYERGAQRQNEAWEAHWRDVRRSSAGRRQPSKKPCSWLPTMSRRRTPEPNNRLRYAEAETERFSFIEGVVSDVSSLAHYQRIRLTFLQQRWTILARAAVAAVSIAVFAWAANPATLDESEDGASRRAVEVLLTGRLAGP